MKVIVKLYMEQELVLLFLVVLFLTLSGTLGFIKIRDIYLKHKKHKYFAH